MVVKSRPSPGVAVQALAFLELWRAAFGRTEPVASS